MATVQIRVQGMTCGGCTASVERALGRVAGVQSATASLERGLVDVEMDDGDMDAAVVTREQLVQVITAAGYDVPAQER